jgi:hypothetical protein
VKKKGFLLFCPGKEKGIICPVEKKKVFFFLSGRNKKGILFCLVEKKRFFFLSGIKKKVSFYFPVKKNDLCKKNVTRAKSGKAFRVVIRNIVNRIRTGKTFRTGTIPFVSSAIDAATIFDAAAPDLRARIEI